MPNWCECELVIFGSVQERNRFVKRAMNAKDSSVLLDFENFTPIPNEVRESENHRDWCIKNWGTKWNLGDDTTIRVNGAVNTEYAFMTAWSPPLPVVEAMGKQFPTLEFYMSYWEGGVGFMGRLHVHNGEVVLREQGPYTGTRGG